MSWFITPTGEAIFAADVNSPLKVAAYNPGPAGCICPDGDGHRVWAGHRVRMPDANSVEPAEPESVEAQYFAGRRSCNLGAQRGSTR